MKMCAIVMLLLKEFGEEKQSLDFPHMCCDICAKVCNCEGEACKKEKIIGGKLTLKVLHQL